MTNRKQDFHEFKEALEELQNKMNIDVDPYIEKYHRLSLQLEELDKEREAVERKQVEINKILTTLRTKPLEDINLDVYEFIKDKPNKRAILNFLYNGGFISSRENDKILGRLWRDRDTYQLQYRSPYEERG